MNEYQSTVNLPGQPAFTPAPWPDSAETAVLVGLGILIPCKRSFLEPLSDDSAFQPSPSPDGATGALGEAGAV